jgi:hypothetical protein
MCDNTNEYPIYICQAVSVNEQDVSSSKGLDGQKTSAADDQSVNHAPSREGYIELNDFLNSDSSASTSEYSSQRTMISEEYFDSDAFLREIRNDHNAADEEHTDSKFSVAAASKSDCVVISPPEQGNLSLLLLVPKLEDATNLCVCSRKVSVTMQTTISKFVTMKICK